MMTPQVRSSMDIHQGNNDHGLMVAVNNGQVRQNNIRLVIINPLDEQKPTPLDFKHILRKAVGEELSSEDLDDIVEKCYNYVRLEAHSHDDGAGVPLHQVLDYARTINEPLKKTLANTEDILRSIAKILESTKATKKKTLVISIIVPIMIALVVAIIIVACLVPYFVRQGQPDDPSAGKTPDNPLIEYEGFDVIINDDGETVTVSINTQKDGTEVEFPTFIQKDGKVYRVTAVGKAGLTRNDKIQSVNLSTSIERIESGAFANFSALKEISIPDSVTYIGNAFQGCLGLKNVNVNDVQAWCKISFDGTYSNPLVYAKNLTLGKERISGEIVLDEGITAIPAYTFFGSAITRLELPDSVTTIGNSAFADCGELSEAILSPNITSLPKGLFSGCGNLQKLTLPFVGGNPNAGESVEGLFGFVFGDSEYDGGKQIYQIYGFFDGMFDLILPELDMTWAEQRAYQDAHQKEFDYLSNLMETNRTGFYIPTSLRDVTFLGGEISSAACLMFKKEGDQDFVPMENSFLQFTLGESITSIGSGAFSYCSSLQSLNIPNSVTSIGRGAFANCSSLEKVMISSNVTSIGFMAFYGCRQLDEITIAADNSYYGAHGGIVYYRNKQEVVFCGEGIKGVVNLPEGVTSVGAGAFGCCSLLTAIIIPDSVISIGSGAFAMCSGLRSITIGSGVTSIGYQAFNDCNSLESVTFGDESKLTSIQEDTFWYCSSLKSIEIPDSVTLIGNNAFYGCNSLTSIVIPDSVTSIGDHAFYGCSSLTRIVIPDSVTLVGYDAFLGCVNLNYHVENNANYLGNANNPYVVLVTITDTSLTSFKINKKTRLIYGSAFRGCRMLTSIEIPDSVTYIGSDAFWDCDSIESIEIPDSVTLIENNAFGDCYSLESIVIPDSVTYIGSGAFRFCSSLKSIEIPDSVTSIGSDAFWGCSSLVTIVISDSVTYIGIDAFRGCSSLTIYCEAEEKPSGWDENWNPDDRPVVWGYKTKS